MRDVSYSTNAGNNDASSDERIPATNASFVRLHLQAGLWSLLLFLSFGVFLESLHGFKLGWYLDVGQETRRLMWTLAHAHGTLISLIHVAFSFAISVSPGWNSGSTQIASRCLLAAGILIPMGFFLGGLFFEEGTGDPGLGILLVPAGAALLFVAVLLTALKTKAAQTVA